SAANWSGVPTTIVPESKLSASVGSSHVRNVCSEMSCRARSSRRVQTSAADSVMRCGKGRRGREGREAVWESQRVGNPEAGNRESEQASNALRCPLPDHIMPPIEPCPLPDYL